MCLLPLLAAYVLLTHQLSQSTKTAGLTKIFFYFTVSFTSAIPSDFCLPSFCCCAQQICIFMVGDVKSLFGWLSIFNFAPQDSTGPRWFALPCTLGGIVRSHC